MIHEAVTWSNVYQQWFILPRRASKDKYDEVADERRATNILLRANQDFSQIISSRVGKLHPTHGFSSFKFVPETNDQLIVALKSEEDAGKIASYVTVFDIKGNILLDEFKIGNHKFEGIEFI